MRALRGEVKHFTAIIDLLLAVFAILFGAMGTDFRLGGLGRTPTSKPVPTWLGRLWFFALAGVLLFMGIHGLLK